MAGSPVQDRLLLFFAWMEEELDLPITIADTAFAELTGSNRNHWS
jgi:hypothetical protein